MKNGPYELIIAPSNYPGKLYRGRYCYEHHLVWWKNTGQVIKEGEIVHHKNHKKRDNRFENLELLPSASHSTLHGKLKKPIIRRLKCCFCKNYFQRRLRDIKTKKKQGYRHHFCDRTCMAKAYGRGRPINHGR